MVDFGRCEPDVWCAMAEIHTQSRSLVSLGSLHDRATLLVITAEGAAEERKKIPTQRNQGREGRREANWYFSVGGVLRTTSDLLLQGDRTTGDNVRRVTRDNSRRR